MEENVSDVELDFVIIGAAQAGLSMAYYLKKQGKRFLLVDKEPDVGRSWLNRWHSLRLFTPTEFNHLPGMPFPAVKGHYPSKYEVADYFKAYVRKYAFPITLNTLITRVEKVGNIFHVIHAGGCIKTRGVIVATGPFHIPYTPACHKQVAADVFQIHSNHYQCVSQLQDGPVLVVGDGDSGYQIVDEVSSTGRETYFSGHTDVKTLPQVFLGKTLWWWLTVFGLLKVNRHTWLGKRLMSQRQPVIGTDVQGILKRNNVHPVGRTHRAGKQGIETEKRLLAGIKNIIWATGYRPDFSWIQGLAIEEDGYPVHQRGVSPVENLYFIGLPWLYTRGSATLGGVGKDAAYLAGCIAKT